jgi:hypothetical protein
MSVSFLYASNTLAAFAIGVIVLCVSVWLLVDRAVFFGHATSSEAPIVNVAYESVPKGRGSAKGYVPVVEVASTSQSPVEVKVDTYNQDPVYIVGSKLQVLCNLTQSPVTCVENSVVEYFAPPIIALLIGLGSLSLGLYFRKNAVRTDGFMRG